MTKTLIVNSDDFGMSEGVSRGIIEAHQRGIVTSTTTMINMPAAEAAIKTAQQSAPELGLGLHLTLSFGAPVSPPESVPSLVEADGRFVTTYQDLIAKMPEFTAEDLERELTAQFERFRAIAGRLPTHLDSHHGATHFHPLALDVMLRLAHAHQLPIRWADNATMRNDFSEEERQMAARLEAVVQKNSLPRHSDHFVDFIFDFASTDRLDRLKQGLRNLKEGVTELMVHVGYAEGLDEAYTFQREEELAAITDPSVREIIEAEGIVLVNFDDLPQ